MGNNYLGDGPVESDTDKLKRLRRERRAELPGVTYDGERFHEVRRKATAYERELARNLKRGR